jgi:hypothetical protein
MSLEEVYYISQIVAVAAIISGHDATHLTPAAHDMKAANEPHR